jgi:phosphopantetheinyl transferase
MAGAAPLCLDLGTSPAARRAQVYAVQAVEGHADLLAPAVVAAALTAHEQRALAALRSPRGRQAEWVAARLAAKLAVRAYLWRESGPPVTLREVEIAKDSHGRPHAGGEWERTVAAPAISLTHSEGVAMAIAAPPDGGPGAGIDLQRVAGRPGGFDAIAFTPGERALLAAARSEASDEWRTLLWCAKEATAKALGRGLIEGPRSVEIVAWDASAGIAAATPRGRLCDELPAYAETRLVVRTFRRGALAVAVCLGGER